MADSVTLHFDATTAAWFVGRDGGFWQISGRTAPLILAGYLPLPRTELSSDALRERCRGTVEVQEEEDVCTLRFQATASAAGNDAGAASDTVQVAAGSVPLVFARWIKGYYRDSWVGVTASLELDGADRLGFRLFLPKRADAANKMLRVRCGNRLLMETPLLRGKQQEVWVELEPAIPEQITLEFEFDTPEPQTGPGDGRQLGCVLREMSLSGDRWIDAKALA